jgi:hypothetical protein
VYSVSPALADDFNVNSNYKMVPTNADGSINVKLSDEQLNKIIPKNADGSISVRNAPNSSMDINIQQVGGTTSGICKKGSYAALYVCQD